jgi:hypothetical protein
MDKTTRVITHAVFTKPVKIRSVRPPFFNNEQMLPDEANVTKKSVIMYLKKNQNGAIMYRNL